MFLWKGGMFIQSISFQNTHKLNDDLYIYSKDLTFLNTKKKSKQDLFHSYHFV